jgi:adenine-specific DNA-methyltransferase
MAPASEAHENELVALALALGARGVGPLSPGEERLAARTTRVPRGKVTAFREAIARGEDPLGDTFCALRSPVERRPLGATYTPRAVVTAMTEWAARATPARVVDAGAGSGRFVVAAGRRFPRAALLATEVDPLALLALRAHLAAAGLARRARVVAGDYRSLALDPVRGPTLFIGNPPYVRHHAIGAEWKAWLVRRANELGLRASQLAGLHVHFFLATAHLARPGDYGAFVTAAEWLDVNYGALVRRLLLGPLGGTSIHVVEPTLPVFPDAQATAAITCFEVGSRAEQLALGRVTSMAALGQLAAGRPVRRERLERSARWTPLTTRARSTPAGYIELGELCRVHRGQVTGKNSVWIAGPESGPLPESVLYAAVTKARELFAAGHLLADVSGLRRVIDLPADLDALPAAERAHIERFLRAARRLGADRGFIARHRRAWWSVGLYEPAPILATYMARRPPAFVRNPAGARHLNIAHGLYPRAPLSPRALDALARYLSSTTNVTQGRTYAGGLTKFEPREMERLPVPAPELLEATPVAFRAAPRARTAPAKPL